MSERLNKKSGLEQFLLENMFEHSLFSDLSLVFLHPSFPFSMRFNVHRAIVSQSPFLYNLLKHMERIPSEGDHGQGITSLTIDLAKAWDNCGFQLAPFEHIVRRQWQKLGQQGSNKSNSNNNSNCNPLLTSHIRFVLQWFYCIDKESLLNTIQDCDTLCILSIAILLDVHDLAQSCVDRYINEQLSLDSIMRDLETICQLPRKSRSYLQLRDATLLLLFRLGPTHPARLAMLPVDYMADVLGADPLFITNEFERYCLLKSVLVSFMQSVGKITWTDHGPVDENEKRLSGFVKPSSINKKRHQLLSNNNNANTTNNNTLSASELRSRKRKRIPSEDLEEPEESKKLSRLSFTALVPFEKLLADSSSGGIIDKATVLSYLLKTTVNYSNMTFDQLTIVRQDSIVDESIVFRALWQREALERVLYPSTLDELQRQYSQQQRSSSPTFSMEEDEDDGLSHTGYQQDRNAALDEYFDVDGSAEQERRRRLLLGTPKFRFSTSVFITPPNEQNGWHCERKQPKKSQKQQQQQQQQQQSELSSIFDDDDNDSDGSLWTALDDNNNNSNNSNINSGSGLLSTQREIVRDLEVADKLRPSSDLQSKSEYEIYTQTFYSEPQIILGVAYRVQIEAQVIPRYLVHIRDTDEDDDDDEEMDILPGKGSSSFVTKHSNQNYYRDNVIVCRFELQRDMKRIDIPIKQEKKSTTTSTSTLFSQHQEQDEDEQVEEGEEEEKKKKKKNGSDDEKEQEKETTSSNQFIPKKSKIHYWIYCLNRYEGVFENVKVDPEDRMLVAVTEQKEREDGEDGEMEPGYVGQVLIDSDLKRGITIDVTVALEIFGFAV